MSTFLGIPTAPDGVEVAYYDLGGSGPVLLLAHATGFCGAVLAQFCSTYQANRPGLSPAAALVYLVVPLAISEDLAPTPSIFSLV